MDGWPRRQAARHRCDAGCVENRTTLTESAFDIFTAESSRGSDAQRYRYRAVERDDERGRQRVTPWTVPGSGPDARPA